MNLAIIHYHLDPGGVSHVIAAQLASLEHADRGRPARVAIIHGRPAPDWAARLPRQLSETPLTLHRVAELDYDRGQSAGPDRLARRLTECMGRLSFAPADTVVHVHNHSLGKNLSLPGAVAALAAGGYALLLQLHDFAEDFRPANYRRLSQALADGQPARLPERLYPQAPAIHYAVLNRRDERILARAGVPPERLHRLPNPVLGPGDLPARSEARAKLARLFALPDAAGYVLYPVRAIRRKNVGETLLWAVLGGRRYVFGISLPTINPAERPVYREWQSVARRLELPVLFETGASGRLSLVENLAAADLVLTTSLAEGFGMAFLESWLAGRPLAGRDLPEVTEDYLQAGVDLSTLRPRLQIPTELVGRQRLTDRLESAYRRTLAAYGLPPASLAAARQRWEPKTSGPWLDFGDLDEPLQAEVVEAARRQAAVRQAIGQANPWLGQLWQRLTAGRLAELVCSNAAAVRAAFGLAPSGHRIGQLYDRVQASRRGGPVQGLSAGYAVLDSFLSPDRFRLIRT